MHSSDNAILKDVRNVVAVASGKGGVGKSTVAVNLALALAETGAAVGLLDADVYGPSMPTMLGINETPQADPQTGMIAPLERYGLKVMSMGFIVGDNAPIIWRGPMVHKLLQQFLGQVAWGPLDYLIIDLPPGTGDAQLTLTQSAPLSGAVIVTTPQLVALLDAQKGLRMFQQVNVPVLGIVENMSYFVCPGCRERTDIFRHGGGKRAAEQFEVPFLGAVPLEPDVVIGGDEGVPAMIQSPDSESARAFRDIAGKVAAGLNAAGSRASEIPALSL